MNSKSQVSHTWLGLAVGMICFALTVSMSAQVKTETTTTSGTPTHVVKVERAEVVYVAGNELILKMEDGTIRDIPNVPESARATVNGQEIGIHDVKVGMKLEKTITTTTTPKTVRTVDTVTGKVWHVTPPHSVILTMDNGQNQQFKIPKGQQFNVEGQMVDAWGLKKGMKVSATRIVEVPETHATQTMQLTGSTPPPPPPADQPILIAVLVPAPAEVASAELPKTGSSLPLIGLLGLLLIASSFGLKFIRN